MLPKDKNNCDKGSMGTKLQIIIEEKEIYFQVSYGKREKISLEISVEGQITIKAPQKTPEYEIMKFMNRNKKQLLAVIHRQENQTVIKREKTYEEEEYYLYLGKAYGLEALIGTVPEDKEESAQLLKRFYTQKTKEIVKDRVKHYEKIINVSSKSLTVVDSPASWGTCNNRRELTFNYRLSMAPIPVIDSVVIHELCHLLHLNHDRSFWRKVGMYDSEYKEHEAYLARFGYVMTI